MKNHRSIKQGKRHAIDADGNGSIHIDRPAPRSREVEQDDEDTRARAFLHQHPEVSQRDSSRVDPIRLNRQRVLPLNRIDAHGKERMCDIAEPEPEFCAEVDWNGIVRAANLTRLESRIFLTHWRGGVPKHKLPVALGCGWSDVDRAYRSVVQKVLTAASPGVAGNFNLAPVKNSLRPAYLQRFRSGVRTHSLAGLDVDFQEIMLDEKYNRLISERDPGEFLRRSFVLSPIVMELHKLHDDLRAAQLKLDGHVVKSQAIDDEIMALESNLDELMGADDNTLLSPDYAERVSSAELSLKALTEKRRAYQIVIDRARAEVLVIEDKIHQRRHEAFMLDFREPAKGSIPSLHQLADKFKTIQEIGIKHKIDGCQLAIDLRPDVNSMVRNYELKAINALLELARFKEHFLTAEYRNAIEKEWTA